MLFYQSTRGRCAPVTPAEAIKTGMASDGGLFVPDRPVLFPEAGLKQLAGLPYRRLAEVILEPYLPGFSAAEIRACVASAYGGGKFTHPEVAPVKKVDHGLYFLELWHGPTCAFKDFALQLLPHLLAGAAAKTEKKEKTAILVATSGDTGKAALEGFKNVPGTILIVFYPAGGVSEVQRLQMVTQEGENVHVVAVEGNFDQAQSGVKEIFGNARLAAEAERRGYRFSSANSINWGRLLPQIVYYFYAYLSLSAAGELAAGEEINFVVPTGNFGNILAAFYARKAGLPVHRLVLAANSNNVLTDFINTGVYDRNRVFHKTISPSMDILISSNLERLLFESTGRDGEKVAAWMTALKETGRYQIDSETHARIAALFWSAWAGEQETREAIRHTYRQYGYLLDPHTAVGRHVYERYRQATGDGHKTVIVSTASPFKFNRSVVEAIWGSQAAQGKNEFELLEFLSRETGLPVPRGLRDLEKKPVLHTLRVRPEEMPAAVKAILSGGSRP
ncbi:MAG: threonine synthase [Desulfotomaculales bacterium]